TLQEIPHVKDQLALGSRGPAGLALAASAFHANPRRDRIEHFWEDALHAGQESNDANRQRPARFGPQSLRETNSAAHSPIGHVVSVKLDLCSSTPATSDSDRVHRLAASDT